MPRCAPALAMLPCWTTANSTWRARRRTRRPIRLSQSRRVAIRIYLCSYRKIALLLLASLFLFFNAIRTILGAAMAKLRSAVLAAGMAIGVLAAPAATADEEWPQR